MIHYLTAHVDDRLMVYPSRWGGPQARMRFLPYERLPAVASLEPGTYLFADLESLTPAELELAATVSDRLRMAPSGFRVINDPRRVLCRRALLERLFAAGINTFRAHPADAARAIERFPVFVRRPDDHAGVETPLLQDVHELVRALRYLRFQGHRLADLMVVEFCDTIDRDGLYRKYAAFVVGDRILPRHVLFSRHWVQKQPDLQGPELERETSEFLDANPHEAALRDIFQRAGIGYGRIDYGLRDGRPQVWEINTHPTVTRMTPRLTRAFEDLENDGSGAPPLDLVLERSLVERARRERAQRRRQDSLRRAIHRIASRAVTKPFTRSLRRLLGSPGASAPNGI